MGMWAVITCREDEEEDVAEFTKLISTPAHETETNRTQTGA